MPRLREAEGPRARSQKPEGETVSKKENENKRKRKRKEKERKKRKEKKNEPNGSRSPIASPARVANANRPVTGSKGNWGPPGGDCSQANEMRIGSEMGVWTKRLGHLPQRYPLSNAWGCSGRIRMEGGEIGLEVEEAAAGPLVSKDEALGSPDKASVAEECGGDEGDGTARKIDLEKNRWQKVNRGKRP